MKTADRLPPFDAEAEEQAIAAALVDHETVEKMAEFLRPEHFFREPNGLIWSAILDVFHAGEVPNQVTVADRLRRHKTLEVAGGQTRMAQLVHSLTTAYGAEWYGRIVERCWQKRELLRAASRLAERCYDLEADPEQSADEAMNSLLRLGAGRARPLTRRVGDILSESEEGDASAGLLADVERFMEDPLALDGLALGWLELDALLHGVRPSELITLVADTGIGKSFLCQHIACQLARAGVAAMYVTTEMSGKEVSERLLFMAAGVNRQAIVSRARDGYDVAVTEHEANRLRTVAAEMLSWPLYVSDVGQPKVETVVSETRRLRAQAAVQLVIVDHIQHVRVAGARDDVQRLTEVSGAMKALAVNEYVAVLQVSQVGREAAKSGWVDLYSGRSSGAIEQDSNVMLTLNQVDREGNGFVSRREADEFKTAHGYVFVRVDVAKNRRGPQGWDTRALDFRVGGRLRPLAEVGR